MSRHEVAAVDNSQQLLLHFACVVDDAKCIVVTRVCVYVCLSVCLSAAVRAHYCMDPDVTWGHGRGLRALLAADWRVTGGVLNITAAAWTAGYL